MCIKYLSLIFSALLCFCGTADKEIAVAPQYEPVRGWPEFPEHITLDQTPGIAVDSQDRVYIFHRGEHPILCFSREGKFLRSFGDGYVNRAHGLEISPDNTVWVTDNRDHVVIQFSPEGELLQTLGTRGKAGETETTFNMPTDVAVTPAGDLYVTDGYGNSRVVKFSKEFQFQHAWGDSGTGAGQFNIPHANAIDSQGRLFVYDRENSRIQIYSPEDVFLTMWTHIGQPWGIFITGDDQIFVVDGKNNNAMLLSIEGEIITTWGGPGTEPGQFDVIHDIAVDSHGDVYIAEILNMRVQISQRFKECVPPFLPFIE